MAIEAQDPQLVVELLAAVRKVESHTVEGNVEGGLPHWFCSLTSSMARLSTYCKRNSQQNSYPKVLRLKLQPAIPSRFVNQESIVRTATLQLPYD